MVAVGQEFWIVAAGCDKQAGADDKEKLFQQLKSNKYVPAKAGSDEGGPWEFKVPDGERSLMFGSFDSLVRLTDDLQKADQQLDSIVHRFERLHVEFNPKSDFRVKSQRQDRTLDEYLKTWQWDEAKYPRTRSIQDNLTAMVTMQGKLDEEVRSKTAQYNETKGAMNNLAAKDGQSLGMRDLVDVLTPEVVAGDDFVYSERLTTVVVILSKGTEKDFLSKYEQVSFTEYNFTDNASMSGVVPMSARQFKGVTDKDGTTVWRVVMFKQVAEAFKKACRANKFHARDFEYSADAHAKLIQNRETLNDQLKKMDDRIKGLLSVSWSDAVVAWMHVKAMRIFVESVLRFGMPPRFASYIIQPKAGSPQNLRKALADILGKGGQAAVSGEGGGDDEDYYPYVSFSFTPFTTART